MALENRSRERKRTCMIAADCMDVRRSTTHVYLYPRQVEREPLRPTNLFLDRAAWLNKAKDRKRVIPLPGGRASNNLRSGARPVTRACGYMCMYKYQDYDLLPLDRLTKFPSIPSIRQAPYPKAYCYPRLLRHTEKTSSHPTQIHSRRRSAIRIDADHRQACHRSSLIDA